MSKRCGSSLPVLSVVFAIGYIYFTTTLIFIDRWFGLWSSPGLMNAIVFTTLAIMCVSNYAIAISTDPGRVPASFLPDVEDVDSPIHEIKRKSGDLRYCQKCSQYKPPRAHHCRVCKRCILRMDHHCIWINNCVGHANYKVFFVFVLYASIACIYSLVLLLGCIMNDSLKNEQQSEGSSRAVYVIYAVLVIPLTIALVVLFGWHVYLIFGNKTTIEYYEGVRAMWLAEKGGEVYMHPYDLGPLENLTAVLGPNMMSWVCPTSKHIGSGLRFRTRYDKLTTGTGRRTSE
ncbi:Probable protein S-acyltransferase 16 [Dionaea muscipula]